MDKILEALHQQALDGSLDADKLYWATDGLNDDEKKLWFAENQDAIRNALRIDLLATNKKADKSLLKAFNDMRVESAKLFTGAGKQDAMGRQMKTLDDFMSAFGVTGANGADLSDDERSAFTNPENSAYWGNKSAEDKELAALSLGYEDFDAMKDDLDRAGRGYQTRNQVEGWGPNNEFQVGGWLWSALVGLGAPRIKDAQLAGRSVNWQDVAGDLAELGLNFVPGVGLVSKAGRVVAKIPGVGKVANSAIGSMVGQGAALAADQLAVPVATQALDANILYNPNVLGTEASAVDPRSKFDWKQVGLQAGGIAGAKGAVKGSAMMAKNVLEQGLGNEVGGQQFRNVVQSFERIGEKTDDLIRRRQVMLDRKAELAKQSRNVTLPGDADISGNVATPDDLIDAENFRVLTNEANRIKNSKKLRDDYRTYVRGKEAELTQAFNDDWTDEGLKQRVDAGRQIPRDIWSRYRKANEAGAENIAQLDDGRFVRAKYLNDEGLRFDGSDYTIPLKDNSVLPMEFVYDDARNHGRDAQLRIDDMGGVINPDFYDNPYVRHEIGIVSTGSRNPAVQEAIMKDDLLRRKLNGATATVENLRDTGANVAFNAMAREGLAGNSSINDLEKKRADAVWNRTMMQLRPLTANSNLPIETRRANASAIMNVMQNGLDGISDEEFAKNPRLYHIIADRLGVTGWKHPSEVSNPTPSTSYSSAY